MGMGLLGLSSITTMDRSLLSTSKLGRSYSCYQVQLRHLRNQYPADPVGDEHVMTPDHDGDGDYDHDDVDGK